MLFNSFEFLFIFLPVVVVGFAVLQYAGPRYLILWLIAASLAFYANWRPEHLPVLISSVLFNFIAGRAIFNARANRARAILVFALVCNLAALAFFKYAAFLVGTVNDIAGAGLPIPKIELPIGISFYTFTQIAFLVDAYQKRLAAERGLNSYALFVTYFPHLIAGPILHHKQMMGQFAQPDVVRIRAVAWAVGSTYFAIGLAKKVLLADPLGAYATPLFNAARDGATPSFIDAWTAALTYTFQLYFDFSGYSDMAIGLSLLFGIQIPINFNSPYRSTNIIEFWRRWHISLSTFLRDYLYIPLGGSRHGTVRRYFNLLITMVLGGLWHGASWTFVAWGALHGFYLLFNHAWRALFPLSRHRAPSPWGNMLGGAITFFAVVIAWVFFRADNFPTALRMLSGMASAETIPTLADALIQPDLLALLQSGALVLPGLLSAAALIAFLFPNSNRIGAAVETSVQDYEAAGRPPLMFLAAMSYGLLLGVAIVCMGRATQFLYFQF